MHCLFYIIRFFSPLISFSTFFSDFVSLNLNQLMGLLAIDTIYWYSERPTDARSAVSQANLEKIKSLTDLIDDDKYEDKKNNNLMKK